MTNNSKDIKTTLIVSYKKGIKTEDFKTAKKGLKFKKEEKCKYTHQDILEFDTEQEALEVKVKLEKRGNVLMVEFDSEGEGSPETITNDDYATTHNFHMAPNPNIPNDNFDWTKLKQINDNMGPKPTVLLAVIDDGVKTDHLDLAGKLVDGFSAHQNLLQSKGGVINVPDQSHGTLVTGMAVAITNNGRDASSIGGIFSNVKVLPISVYDPTGKTYQTSSFVRAINHAISRGVVAINLSWGGFSKTSLEIAFQSAYNAGIANFVSAGNGTQDLSVTPRYPASHPTTYAIGNVEKDMKNLRASSNWGNTKFVGNGSSVVGLNIYGSAFGTTGGGTSSASPHVASIYTTMRGIAHPDLTRDDLIQFISDSVHKILPSHKFGEGYPNAVEAIRMARFTDNTFTQKPLERNTPVDKIWTVELEGFIDVTKMKGIYVVDLITEGKVGKEHLVHISAVGKTLTIKPNINYSKNTAYMVVVSDLYDIFGKKLKNLTIPFMTVRS